MRTCARAASANSEPRWAGRSANQDPVCLRASRPHVACWGSCWPWLCIVRSPAPLPFEPLTSGFLLLSTLLAASKLPAGPEGQVAPPASFTPLTLPASFQGSSLCLLSCLLSNLLPQVDLKDKWRNLVRLVTEPGKQARSIDLTGVRQGGSSSGPLFIECKGRSLLGASRGSGCRAATTHALRRTS